MPSGSTPIPLVVLSQLRHAPRWLVAPATHVLLQPILDRIAMHVARSRPELFVRLGIHANKRFLIDPVELPFPLFLVPNASNPRLVACDRRECPACDARVSGTFSNLLDMISGSIDGDALFFNRDLSITGDVEAVVALRNALDDFDGSVVDTIIGAFGPLSGAMRFALAALHNSQGGRRHA